MVDSLYILAEQVMLWYLLAAGVALVVQTGVWVDLVQWMLLWDAKQYQAFVLLFCIGYLPFGLFIVLSHNEWIMSYSVVVTIFGWLVSLKCAAFLIYPKAALKLAKVCYGNKSVGFLKMYFRAVGVMYILLSGLVWSLQW